MQFSFTYIFIPILIIAILLFCVFFTLLIIKRKTLKISNKIILMILLAIVSIPILFSIVLLFGFYNQKSENVAAYSMFEDNEINDDIKFNGVYYREGEAYTEYFRFYENGIVIMLTSIGKYNEKILINWSHEYYDDFVGYYIFEENSIIITIHSGNDLIEYSGINNGNNMIIKQEGKNNEIYLYKEIESWK